MEPKTPPLVNLKVPQVISYGNFPSRALWPTFSTSDSTPLKLNFTALRNHWHLQAPLVLKPL